MNTVTADALHVEDESGSEGEISKKFLIRDSSF